jgi:hypothetical protein
MEIEHIPETRMNRRYGEGTLVGLKCEVTDQRFIENLIDRLSVVLTTLGQPSHSGSFR